jgi:hypothetical protein
MGKETVAYEKFLVLIKPNRIIGEINVTGWE